MGPCVLGVNGVAAVVRGCPLLQKLTLVLITTFISAPISGWTTDRQVVAFASWATVAHSRSGAPRRVILRAAATRVCAHKR